MKKSRKFVENDGAEIAIPIFEQAQKIAAMRQVKNGNSSYLYGEILKCPHCGKPLVHGSLNSFYYKGRHIQDMPDELARFLTDHWLAA